MPNDTSGALVDLGELAKPATTLIEKISEAVGGLFAPWQIKRIAKAEAEAAVLKQTHEIEITDLHRRAIHRWIAEEAQCQLNIEDITVKALPRLIAEADPMSMENDWLVNFFDKSRIVSDNEMQKLWSHVLAGEANVPGTYSKRTVNFLSDLDKTEAVLFTKLCGFVWFIGAPSPLVFDEQARIYNRHGIDFANLNHLDSIGLIQYGGPTGFLKINLPKRFSASYYQREITLEMPKDVENELEVGKVMLTRIGRELAPICEARPVEGFWEYVKTQWKQYLPESERGDRSSSDLPTG